MLLISKEVLDQTFSDTELKTMIDRDNATVAPDVLALHKAINACENFRAMAEITAMLIAMQRAGGSPVELIKNQAACLEAAFMLGVKAAERQREANELNQLGKL